MVKFYVKMILPLVLILPGCVPPEPESEVKPKTAVELRPLSDKVKGTSKSYFHFIAGYREELAGNLKEAESSYFQAVRNNPDSSFLSTRLASLLVRQGKLAEAEKFALKATTQNAKNLEAHFVLGGIYASRTKLDKAVATYTELLKMSPEHQETRLLLGSVYLDLGKYPEAAETLEVLVKLGRRPVLGRYHLAQAYAGMKKYGEAEKEISQLLERAPKFTRGMLLLARIYEVQEKFGEAEATYIKAQKIEPDNRLIRSRLGQLYIRKKNMKQALEEFKVLGSKEPGNVRVHRTLGFLKL